MTRHRQILAKLKKSVHLKKPSINSDFDDVPVKGTIEME